MIKYLFNNREDSLLDIDNYVNHLENNTVVKFHSSIEGYQPTPLLEMPVLSKDLGIKKIYVKDESSRFGIKSFKGLGASYSIFQIVKTLWEKEYHSPFHVLDIWNDEKIKKLGQLTFAAATDGNHGKAVAWFSKLINQNAVIYMPSSSSQSRINAIKEEGGKVVLIDGSFDECVKRCNIDSTVNGWQIVSDTSYPGNMENPKNVLLGYTTIYKEIDQCINEEFDYIFIPTGVGGVAAAGALYFNYYKNSRKTKLVTVEPESSDCLYESLKNNKPSYCTGIQDSIMVGLNCGFPSLSSWEILRNSVYLSLVIPDKYAIQGMRKYHDVGIVSGETGSGSLAGVLSILDKQNKSLADKMELKNSTILILNTEGDTDTENYKRIISGNFDRFIS
ncbi:diaminopropionate ammonia-lyase [Bacillus cereus]|uniref:diaminopropionate ammonia-lyase n=1 Tax=Bacillus cereus TaxID=1396 RepID=UPI003980DB54